MSEVAAESVLPWITPEDVFADLAGTESDLFWLDSGDTGVSHVGIGVRADERDVAATSTRSEHGATGPMPGGWVGWLDYESGAVGMTVPANGPTDARWLRVTDVATFDHDAHVLTVRGSARFLARVADARPAGEPPVAPMLPDARADIDAREHERRVEACRAAILDGDAYQLCLTTRFTVPGEHDAVETYRRLRAAAPSHHGGFIRIAGTALLSISPELFLSVQGDRVRTKPIKGTRPRGLTPAEDDALAAELAADEKERAENVMIVDLMRNDLSRVCTPGSVSVPELWAVETYPTVHQLVSTVEGVLRPGVRVSDIWSAAFPAGSMTGAPKQRAMTILAALEGRPRGVYSGCFGWVGDDGGMDLAMVIRSVVVTASEAYVGSGGGITWGSRAAMEVAEVGVKARVPLAALGSACPPGW